MADSGVEERTVNAVEEEGEETILEGMAVLDFDMLCATVAMQTQGILAGKGGKMEGEEEGGEFGGVQRMWEGEVLDCFDDRRIVLETVFCPCYRFGKNMGRAGFGSCFLQGTIYLILAATALLNYVAFGVTRRHSFLYLAVAFTISVGTYLGLFRTQIRKQFNIGGSDSSLDDCVNHIVCPCCTLCQESRTLEINNVQDGVWHGRGDAICIGRYGEGSKAFFELRQPPLMPTKSPEFNSMERGVGSDNHAWDVDISHSEPLVPLSQ
ncbi:protein PLANT CADMIUM RESISTANCE 8 isoform X1 [Magnolia sinica]|uniref:protein PLANT CADMIUM RESISTANCE 8 isoform X1 n=1 Tax=Magnolia sinica TaxID=86752 RepID=UPI00265A8B81|nr:protein PLANT CADMIUM RESISTANCE 8 isoform X1 [Magnolia sinica]